MTRCLFIYLLACLFVYLVKLCSIQATQEVEFFKEAFLEHMHLILFSLKRLIRAVVLLILEPMSCSNRAFLPTSHVFSYIHAFGLLAAVDCQKHVLAECPGQESGRFPLS